MMVIIIPTLIYYRLSFNISSIGRTVVDPFRLRLQDLECIAWHCRFNIIRRLLLAAAENFSVPAVVLLLALCVFLITAATTKQCSRWLIDWFVDCWCHCSNKRFSATATRCSWLCRTNRFESFTSSGICWPTVHWRSFSTPAKLVCLHSTLPRWVLLRRICIVFSFFIMHRRLVYHLCVYRTWWYFSDPTCTTKNRQKVVFGFYLALLYL